MLRDGKVISDQPTARAGADARGRPAPEQDAPWSSWKTSASPSRPSRANKMRSILTTLGIIIGVAAVIAVVSIVQGLQYTITEQLQGVGATFIAVAAEARPRQHPRLAARQVKLTSEDAQAIEERVPGVKLMSPFILGRATSSTGTASTTR